LLRSCLPRNDDVVWTLIYLIYLIHLIIFFILIILTGTLVTKTPLHTVIASAAKQSLTINTSLDRLKLTSFST
jgi:uncharacterized protein YpmS